MRSQNETKGRICGPRALAVGLALLGLTLMGLRAADPAAKTYPTPLAAADALLTAGEQKGNAPLLAVLGPEAEEVLYSGDETEDRLNRESFILAAKDKTVLLSGGNDEVSLLVGADDWPFPIPIVKGPQGWYWDTAAGKEEILSRRIGRNELRVLAVCRTYVRAQREYARMNPAGAGAGVYAQKIRSSEGKKDGLFWPVKAGEPESPLGPLAAEAADDGYAVNTPGAAAKPFNGYYFRILTAQGKDAPGGAMSYIHDGKLAGGFALVAWPARYGNSGIMTFVVNQLGIVFQKDLGAKTAEVVKDVVEFDPDITWKPSKQ